MKLDDLPKLAEILVTHQHQQQISKGDEYVDKN
jgi:hypothetical protein